MVHSHPDEKRIITGNFREAYDLTPEEKISRGTYPDTCRLEIPLADPSAMQDIIGGLRALADQMEMTMNMTAYNRYARVSMCYTQIGQVSRTLAGMPISQQSQPGQHAQGE